MISFKIGHLSLSLHLVESPGDRNNDAGSSRKSVHMHANQDPDGLHTQTWNMKAPKLEYSSYHYNLVNEDVNPMYFIFGHLRPLGGGSMLVSAAVHEVPVLFRPFFKGFVCIQQMR